jgi:L-fucose isomerase-like protein
MLELRPQTRPVPKVGIVSNSIGVFSPEAKDKTDAALRKLFQDSLRDGKIDPGSLLLGRLFGPHEAMEAADKLAEARVDLVVVVNVAFPNGQVFLTLATHPQLARIPMAVAADPEPSREEWANNAWCGVIMNNHVAKRIGRPIQTLPGPIGGDTFQAEFERLLRVAGVIKALRRDFLGRFGDAPGGFHSATGDQIAFAEVFGTRVDTVDLTAVLEAYKTGRTSGLLGERTFTDAEVEAFADEIVEGRRVEVARDMIVKASRLFHAYRAIIRANGYTSAAFRCWPEMNERYIWISSCLAQTLLLTTAEITAAGCEGDWPMAVAQTMGSLLSGVAGYCLDWVSYTGASEIIQLGHCGAGVCGAMADRPAACGGPCDTITVHPVIRQGGGGQIGPVLVGPFRYGPKTGICLMQKPDGRFALLSFEGESSAATGLGMKYSSADVLVPDYRELNRIVLDRGFPHHLAVAEGRLNRDLGMLCAFLGVEHISV